MDGERTRLGWLHLIFLHIQIQTSLVHGDLIQSVANKLSDERIRIGILFAKDMLYKYEHEYYS